MGVSITDVRRWYEQRVFDPKIAQYYGRSDFFNFGYWREDTREQKEACENLMEKLLACLPEKRGTILDVACGKGGTTQYLLRYYQPSDVTAVDVSLKQVEMGRLKAPGCRFMLMDATALGFEDGAFDTVMCVEACFHFNTREGFLGEAWRVLRPGGRLLLTDILLTRWGDRLRHRVKENYVSNMQEYRDIYRRAGFQDVEIVDATEECWTRFYRHLLRWHWNVILLSRHDVRTFARFVLQLLVGVQAMKRYLLVSARKV